jgi:hypothetical protein
MEQSKEERFRHIQMNVWAPCTENKRLLVISRRGFRRLHDKFGETMLSGHRTGPGRFDFSHILQPALNWIAENGEQGDIYLTKPMQGIVFCSEDFQSDINRNPPAETILGDRFSSIQHAGYVVNEGNPDRRSLESRYLVAGPADRCLVVETQTEDITAGS